MGPEAKKTLTDMIISMDDYCSSLKETNAVMKNMGRTNLRLTKDIESVTLAWKYIEFFLKKRGTLPERKVRG